LSIFSYFTCYPYTEIEVIRGIALILASKGKSICKSNLGLDRSAIAAPAVVAVLPVDDAGVLP
jgi:hypothetical protein